MIVLYKTFGTYERVRDDYETFYSADTYRVDRNALPTLLKKPNRSLRLWTGPMLRSVRPLTSSQFTATRSTKKWLDTLGRVRYNIHLHTKELK